MTLITGDMCLLAAGTAGNSLSTATAADVCTADGAAGMDAYTPLADPQAFGYETIPNYLGAGGVFRPVSSEAVCLPEFTLDREYSLADQFELLPPDVKPYLAPMLAEAGADLIRFRVSEAVTPDGTRFPQMEVYRVGPEGDPINPSLRQSNAPGSPPPRVTGPSIPVTDMAGHFALYLVIDKAMIEMNVPEKLRLPTTLTTMYVANLAIYNTGLTLSEKLGFDATLMSKMNPNLMIGSIPLTMSFSTITSYLLNLTGEATGVDGLKAGHLPNTIASGTLGLMPIVLSQLRNEAGIYLFPRLAAAVNASLGLTGAGGSTWMGRNLFLARGGMAGGGGALGASFQVLNAAFAVVAGLYIGDAVVDWAIDDGSPEAKLTIMAKNRMYHEAHGWAGGFLGPLASGLLCIAGKGELIEEGLDIAKAQIRDDANNWGGEMNKFLLQVALHSTQGNEAIDWTLFEQTLAQLFANNQDAINRGYNLTELLGQNWGWDAHVAEKVTSAVDRNGRILSRASLQENLKQLALTQFRTKSAVLNRQAMNLGLAYYDGDRLVFQPPDQLTIAQREFLEGEGLQLSAEIAQLSEFLRLLEPQVGDFHLDLRPAPEGADRRPDLPGENSQEEKYA